VATLEITIATWNYNRVRPIIDGRVELCCHSSFSVALFLMFFTHRRMFEDFEKVEKEYYCRSKEENILRRKVLADTRGVDVSVRAP
jgi:hypothetical protein